MKPSVSRQQSHLYQFDSFMLDETERLLLFDGQPVPLTPKAFELLLVLVSHAGSAMTKEVLMEAVWPDAFVEEANLTVNISMLRKALGEMPGGGQYIETLPRRGYRFAATVHEFWGERMKSKPLIIQQPFVEHEAEEERADPESELALNQAPSPVSGVPTSRHKPLMVILTLAVIIGLAVVAYLLTKGKPGDSGQTKRLAVLPFTNKGPGQESEYLGFALADSVINRLDYVKSLVVRPSSYIERYSRQEIEPRQVAKELDVNTLLMGSYIKDGDDLQVNAQLIDVSSGEKLWSESFNVKNYELRQVQDYVARQVVKGLSLNLTNAEGERFDRNVSRDPVLSTISCVAVI
jgi:DNA-binding winged helix-turn-helix (wHTH) protein/TolB-like protein